MANKTQKQDPVVPKLSLGQGQILCGFSTTVEGKQNSQRFLSKRLVLGYLKLGLIVPYACCCSRSGRMVSYLSCHQPPPYGLQFSGRLLTYVSTRLRSEFESRQDQ